jgi:hypothetical protein
MNYFITKDLLIEKFNEDIGTLIFRYVPKPKHIICEIIEDYKLTYESYIENIFFKYNVNPFKMYCHLNLQIIKDSSHIENDYNI